jgi:hypothetical protein
MRPDDLERRIRERLDALGPAPRAELLHVLMLPDFDRADRIGEFWGHAEGRTFAELLIDCEEDRYAGDLGVAQGDEARLASQLAPTLAV